MNFRVPAILGETSEETSYSTVRLVFRPFTHMRRTICTSVSLRASTRVSSGFALCRQGSLFFGSWRPCSSSIPSRLLAKTDSDRPVVQENNTEMYSPSHPYFHFASEYFYFSPALITVDTRTHVRLLGPCFKTGRFGPFNAKASWAYHNSSATKVLQPQILQLTRNNHLTLHERRKSNYFKALIAFRRRNSQWKRTLKPP